MKTKIVRIGNSRGVRLPKPILDQCGFGDEAELRVEGNAVVLSPLQQRRAGWDRAFARMAQAGDDAALLDEAAGTAFDRREWRW